MRTKTLWLWLALIGSSLALIAAGCGGSDEEGSSDTGASTEGGGAEAAEQVITVNWVSEPPSLDPGLATDTTSSNILLNIMDPLIKLDDDLKPVPNAAKSVTTSEDGKTVTFVLRDDLKWTNGDPVTAGDFEYSWKRTASPELGADYAYQFYGIVGAQEYNSCDAKKDDCAALADKMGVKAVDDKTLEVTLTTPQPWFTPAGRASLVPRRAQGDGRASSATSGPSRRTSSRTARSSSTAGSTTPTSTSSRTTTGAMPPASSSPASTAA